MPTLEQIRAKMQKLQKQADALIAKQAQKVVDQIRGMMIEHGLTTADIETAAKRRRQRAAAALSKATSGTGKSRLPPKYRNPKTGETWSGHARPPAWIAGAKDRDKFLIDGTVAADKRASPGQAGQPLYRDPATGKTWTGHGRAPSWIANAADRAAFLIGKGGAGASKKAVAKKAAAKKVAAKKAVAKKAAAKKAVAKKAVATKAAAKKAAVKKAAAKNAVAQKAAKKATTKTASVTKTVAAKKPAPQRARKAPLIDRTSVDQPTVTPPVIDISMTPDSGPVQAV